MTGISKEPGAKGKFQLGRERTMELKAPMTDSERAGLNAQVARESAEMFRLEAEKKALMAPINESLKSTKAREQELLAQLAEGEITKPVSVRTVADFFRGEKWVERLDTDPPEEVPETRVALSDSERQMGLRGVVVPGDTRPDAEVLPLFDAVSGGEAGAEKETVLMDWATNLPKPLERWRVEHAGSTYSLVDSETWQVWGPFDFTHAKGLAYLEGKDGQMPDAVRESLDGASGGPLKTAALLSAMADAIRDRPEEPSASESNGLTLHPLPGLESWSLYLHEGYAWLRPPNVDSQEAPGAATDKGPFRWDAGAKEGKGEWDVPAHAPKSLDEWVKANEPVITCADSLVHLGKVTPPTPRPVTPTLAAVPASSAVEPEESDEPGDEDDIPPPESEEFDEEATAEGVAVKLTDFGWAILALLAQPGAPQDAATIGNRTRCRKPKAALKSLLEKGLIEQGGEDQWFITEDGSTALASRPKGKG